MVSVVIQVHPCHELGYAFLEEQGAAVVGTAIKMCGSFRTLTAIGAPVVKSVLDTAQIPSSRADTYTLFCQPELIHVGLGAQGPVQVSPGNLIEPFPISMSTLTTTLYSTSIGIDHLFHSCQIQTP